MQTINKKKYPCIESTLDIDFGDRKIRLWINEDFIRDWYDGHILAIETVRGFVKNKPSNSELIDFIAKNIPNVNAVQIKGKGAWGVDQGIVAYLVEFNDNVHG